MMHETTHPAALAGANRAGMEMFSLDSFSNTPSPLYAQDYVARKFHVSPVMARLVCDLANIGGRAR